MLHFKPLLKRPRELTRKQSFKLWNQKRQLGWRACSPQWSPPPQPRACGQPSLPVQFASMGARHGLAVLLNPFCPLSTAKVLALKATVVLLLTLLTKARVQIAAGSALGIALLLLQTLVFLAVSGGLVLAAGGAALYATQQRRSAAA